MEGEVAVIEDGELVAGLGDVLDDVGGEQDGAVRGEAGEEVAKADALLRIQAGGGLIDDERLDSGRCAGSLRSSPPRH